jgi:hypothetical protein
LADFNLNTLPSRDSEIYKSLPEWKQAIIEILKRRGEVVKDDANYP